MIRNGKHISGYSSIPRYSSEKRLLAVLLAALYLLQPMQGTLNACFQNVVQIMDSPEYIMGHYSTDANEQKTHRSTEHILISKNDNNLAAKLWQSLSDTDTEGPYMLPEPNKQQKHTPLHREFLLARWVAEKLDFSKTSIEMPLVILPVPIEPPQAS
ncbi:hypothetical protein SAMN04490243_0884 [Robiginitalea myxolifaciens]|uniref:Uncharacterized protein n=1 Tax=Robiginitalea myxolifaciens TaxID=400055 RepID=A0A1I6FXZ6_9FLAO|nr:hypothetical protein [Robiginitalea myxolifaciens]SFR34771.1 hypothetical protein SAMN04490243_0884 [Robiginitalea myxolifaciens]